MPLSRDPPDPVLVPGLTLFPELRGAPAFLGGRCPHSAEPRYLPFWGSHGGKQVSHSTCCGPEPRCVCCPGSTLDQYSAVSLDFSSASSVMRGVDLDCQSRLFPLMFSQGGLGTCSYEPCSRPESSAVFPGKWLKSALLSPCRVCRVQLWTSGNSGANPFFFFFSLQFCIHQQVTKAEQHLLGLKNVEVFFLF